MFYLLCLISLILLIGINLKYIFINEELIMCFSLILFFTIFFNATRKLFLGFFYTEIKSMYLVYYFLFLLNIKLIKNVKVLFIFLANKINYSFLSEFIFSLNRIFFIYEQFKYVNIFTYWSVRWLSYLHFNKKIINKINFVNNLFQIKTLRTLAYDSALILKNTKKIC